MPRSRSGFLEIFAGELAALRGVFLELDQVAVRILDPRLMRAVVADLAAGDGDAARFDQGDERVEIFDLKTKMIVAHQPRIARFLEALERFRRLAATVSIGVVEDLKKGLSAKREVAADGLAVFAQVTKFDRGAEGVAVERGHALELIGF